MRLDELDNPIKGIDVCVRCGNLTFESYVPENLKKWFKEKWVRFGPDGKIRGDCARDDDSEGKLTIFIAPHSKEELNRYEGKEW